MRAKNLLAAILALMVASNAAPASAQGLPQSRVTTRPSNDNSNYIASTKYVDSAIGLTARLAPDGSLSVPSGPKLGTYQNGKFTSQPDALQIQGSGSTGDVSVMSVKPPSFGSVSATLSGLLDAAQPRVANTAFLKQVALPYARIRRDGFAAAGDGSTADYTWSPSNCANPDDGAQVQPTGRTGCWIADVPAVAPLKLWGAKCDGTTDDSSAWSAAVAWAIRQGSATIVLPRATCAVSTVPPINAGTVHIVGQGRSASTVKVLGANPAGFFFNGTTFDSSLEGFTMIAAPTGTPVSGQAVKLSNGVGAIGLRDMRIQGFFNAAVSDNPHVQGVLAVNNVDTSQIIGDSYVIKGMSQFLMSNANNYSPASTGACIHLIDVSGFYFTNVGCQEHTVGLLVDPGPGQLVYDGFLANFEIDSANGNGMILDSSKGGTITTLMASNLRVGYSDAAGIVFNGPKTANISINGCELSRNVEEGIKAINIQNSRIAGCRVMGSGSTKTGFSGISLAGGTGLEFTGNRVTPYYDVDGSTSNQRTAIIVQSTFSGTVDIHDNDLTGNADFALFNGSTSTGISARNNRGYNPQGLTYPGLAASPGTHNAGISPETNILTGGTCSSITVGGVALNASTNPIVIPLQPGQSFNYTCSALPNLYTFVQ